MTVTLSKGAAVTTHPSSNVPQAPELEDFLAESFPEPRRIIGPVSNESIVIVAGGPGTGKTNFAIGLSHAVVSGRDFLGWQVPEKCSVLLVDGEMSGRQLQDRFRLYDFPDHREPLSVVNAISWAARRGLGRPNLSEARWQDILCSWAQGHSVVLLDNVMSLVSVAGTSFSSDEFWRTVTPLNLALRAQGCTVVWFDHTNAEGMPFGTRTKQWLADLVFTLECNESGSKFEDVPGVAFTLAFKKVRGARSIEHQDLAVEMALDDAGKAVWTSRPRKRAEREYAAQLKASGMSQRQIKDEMGISLGKVNKLLQAAARADKEQGRSR